ncbi:hypothetical protein A3K42_01025 [candidate division WWE3 bacterium RBG_13_37_7]|uniref:Uncharacterized protein n=1 Tax=candidate division WWE3 bacterium RBG_13_37_7 TaxID=1802609 RepID=A0A1F4U2F3_UNCKA|nr:MAG: hypothetical protein A3K42_01025 [candidate division WWE3 bacterium RBG_13_37_7]
MKLQNQVNNFLNQIINEITNVGINITNLKIDHIAYSTNTSQEYETVMPKLLKSGELKKEAIIGDAGLRL